MLRYSAPQRIDIRGRRSKCFYSRVYDTDTRKRAWRSTGRTSLRAAQEEIKTWQIGDAQGARTVENRTLGAAVEEWLAFKGSKLTPRALEGYENYAEGWKANLGAGVPLRGLRQGDLERHFALRAETAAAGTLNRERRTIRGFLAWARGRKWLEEDPAATITHAKEPKRAIRALSDDEAAALLRACSRSYTVTKTGARNGSTEETFWAQETRPPAWLHPAVFLLLKLGVRLGTLAALEWRDVNLKTRTIHIRPEIMKTEEGLDVPIDHETAALLEKLKAGASSLRVLDLPHRTAIRTALLAAAKRAGIRPLRVHDLRTSFISRARRAGIPLEVTAKLAGHADARTTLRFYRGLEEAELRAAVEKLGRGGKRKGASGGK